MNRSYYSCIPLSCILAQQASFFNLSTTCSLPCSSGGTARLSSLVSGMACTLNLLCLGGVKPCTAEVMLGCIDAAQVGQAASGTKQQANAIVWLHPSMYAQGRQALAAHCTAQQDVRLTSRWVLLHCGLCMEMW